MAASQTFQEAAATASIMPAATNNSLIADEGRSMLPATQTPSYLLTAPNSILGESENDISHPSVVLNETGILSEMQASDPSTEPNQKVLSSKEMTTTPIEPDPSDVTRIANLQAESDSHTSPVQGHSSITSSPIMNSTPFRIGPMNFEDLPVGKRGQDANTEEIESPKTSASNDTVGKGSFMSNRSSVRETIESSSESPELSQGFDTPVQNSGSSNTSASSQESVQDEASLEIQKRVYRIEDIALLYLPAIGILCGVYEKVPTMMVYAVHDPMISGPCFVLGTGSFVDPGDICFNAWFAPRHLPNDNGMAKMRQKLLESHQKIVKGAVQPYRSVDEVKGMLTFTAAFHRKGGCAAFAALPPPEVGVFREASFLPIRKTPEWDFNTRIAQARPSREDRDALRLKYKTFTERYEPKKLGFHDFCQAAFSLAGLINANSVPFKYDELGNRLNAVGDWGPDDFIVRWAKYEKFVNEKFSLVRCPSPAVWMVARLAHEARKNKKMDPWRGRTGVIPLAEPVIDWEFLMNIEWESGPRQPTYPQRYSVEGVQNRISLLISDLLPVEKQKKPVIDVDKLPRPSVRKQKDTIDLEDLLRPSAQKHKRPIDLEKLPEKRKPCINLIDDDSEPGGRPSDLGQRKADYSSKKSKEVLGKRKRRDDSPPIRRDTYTSASESPSESESDADSSDQSPFRGRPDLGLFDYRSHRISSSPSPRRKFKYPRTMESSPTRTPRSRQLPSDSSPDFYNPSPKKSSNKKAKPGKMILRSVPEAVGRRRHSSANEEEDEEEIPDNLSDYLPHKGITLG